MDHHRQELSVQMQWSRQVAEKQCSRVTSTLSLTVKENKQKDDEEKEKRFQKQEKKYRRNT